jgi:hypothetical protein
VDEKKNDVSEADSTSGYEERVPTPSGLLLGPKLDQVLHQILTLTKEAYTGSTPLL